MNDFFDVSHMSAAEAQYEAQKIAFAPIIFQVARVLRESGILQLMSDERSGLSPQMIAEKLSISKYATTVLLETALSAGIVAKKNELFFRTKIGYFLLNDEMTRINMDFNHFVNYIGLYELGNAIKSGRPSGLKVFSDDDTIYPGLSTLPEDAKKAWFDFDHFYSDSAYEDALKIVQQYNTSKLLEIGGNTGKFSSLCAKTITDCHITVVDLPGQVDVANQKIAEAGLSERIDTYPSDMLDSSTVLPSGFNAVWMSQFLDCFGEEDIIKILKKSSEAIEDDGKIFILEPLWDRQKYETSAFCIINTSPYFTALANGTSKMFNYNELKKCIEKAGLQIEAVHDEVGFSHSLVVCEKNQKVTK